MPAIMRAPGRIAEGMIVEDNAIVMDILPTVLEMAEVDIPDNLDGTSMLPAFNGNALEDRALFFYRSGQLRSMRRGKWKLHVPHRYTSILAENGGKPGSGGHPGAYGPTDMGIALYDLEADPSESIDLKDQFPEIVNTLLEDIEDARAHIGDELTDRVGDEATSPQFIDAVWPTLESNR